MPSSNLQDTAYSNQIARRLAAAIDQQHTDAMYRYNGQYNNLKYVCATAGKDTDYGIELQDAAIALCGSPYTSTSTYALLTRFGDNPHALEFLAGFCPVN